MKKTFPYRYRVRILLFALFAILYIDRITISIVGVRIKAEFGLTNAQFGWVVGAFALAYAIFEIPAGMLGDRIGPRTVLIRIVIIWSLFTALTGLANGLITLMIVRFLFGAGEAGANPNSLIVVSRWFPASETARTVSLMILGVSLGSAIAPLIITPVAVFYGWRAPFFVNGVIGIIWVIICFLWFRNFPSEKKNISKEELMYIESNRRYNMDGHIISLKLILKNRTLRAMMVMYFFNQCSQYFFLAWMPIYLQEGRHFTENQTKPIIFLVFIAGAIGYLASGFFGDRLVRKNGLLLGRRLVAMLGLSLCSALILFIGMPVTNAVAACCLIAASGFYCFGNLVSHVVCADIGRNNSGTVMGAMNFSGQMGAFFIAIVFGKIADITHSFQAPLFLVGLMLLSGCLLWLRIDPRNQISAMDSTRQIGPLYQ